MSTREGQIADAILQMRNPLARVELAASQLARDALTPAARSLAWGISEAVAQIDERIENSLLALRPNGGSVRVAGLHAVQDCRVVLDAIRERMSAVLRAHAIEWTTGSGRDDATPLLVDRDAAEQGALALLRAGITLAGVRGRISLSFTSSDEREGHGIVLEVDPGPQPGAPGDDVFSGPRDLALRLGGSLEVGREGDSIRVVLRFRQAELT